MLGQKRVIRSELFMPWTGARQATSPKFFSRINTDAASYSQSFQPRLSTVEGTPYPGMPSFSGDTGSFILHLEEFEYFKAFFNSRKGRYRTFLLKNWMDYKVTNTRLTSCIDPDTYTQGVAFPDAGDGINKAFVLLKKYKSLKGGENYRRIYKPVLSTLKVFINNILQPETSYRLTLGGRIIFFAAPIGVITFSCEYDLLVRFDSDSYAATVINAQKGSEKFKINAIPVVEVLVSDKPEIEPVLAIVTLTADPPDILENNGGIPIVYIAASTLLITEEDDQKVTVSADTLTMLEGGDLLVTVSSTSLSLTEFNLLPVVRISGPILSIEENSVKVTIQGSSTVTEDNTVIVSISASSLILIEGT